MTSTHEYAPDLTDHYVLIAEGGGWPTVAIGPFANRETAEEYILADKYRESWGSIDTDPRDLPVNVPEDACRRCKAPIFWNLQAVWIDMTGGDACEDDFVHTPAPNSDLIMARFEHAIAHGDSSLAQGSLDAIIADIIHSFDLAMRGAQIPLHKRLNVTRTVSDYIDKHYER